jgi:protein-L-isoaspartate(D-aspartate) O-methyltransferase
VASTKGPSRTSTRRPGSARLRRELVEQLEESGALRSAPVRRAFLALPRERFIPEIAEQEGLERVYQNQAIVTATDERGLPASSSTQPSMMAAMLEGLDLQRNLRVLEIGAGTGYNAALMGRLVRPRGEVVSVELDPATARRARKALASVRAPAKVVRGDGREGWPRLARYDRIIVTASGPSIHRAWHDQLVEGGLLELPLVFGRAGAQSVFVLRKRGDSLCSEAIIPGGFMPLRDAPGAPVPGAPPSLSAGERIGERHRALAHLSGAALSPLSRSSRQRLLAMALSEPRTRRLDVRASRPDLGLYLTVEAPVARLVAGWPQVGVISRGGEGLALLAGGRRNFTRIESYGKGDAERVLLGLIEEWKQRGRPGGADLRVEARFRGDTASEPRLSWAA